ATASDRAARTAELERSVARLRELRTVVPALAQVAELRRAADEAAATLKRLTEQQAVASDQHVGLMAAAKQERQKETAHRSREGELAQQIGQLSADVRLRREQIQQAEQTFELHRRLGAEKAKQFDPDLDAQHARAEEAVADAQAARDAYPYLEAVL